eukprot:2561406-Rhodomonas_salina.1
MASSLSTLRASRSLSTSKSKRSCASWSDDNVRSKVFAFSMCPFSSAESCLISRLEDRFSARLKNETLGQDWTWRRRCIKS